MRKGCLRAIGSDAVLVKEFLLVCMLVAACCLFTV